VGAASAGLRRDLAGLTQLDLAFARGPWILTGEGGYLEYETPNLSPLSARSYYGELERKLGPSWSLAARNEGVFFSDITSSQGITEGWDYDLNRWEVAVNFRFRSGTRVRAGYQHTAFPGRSHLNEELLALQLQVWTR